MKKKQIWLVLLVVIINLSACKNQDKNKTIEKEASLTSNSISFKGVWTREFQIGTDSIQKVIYKIDQDSIQYEMAGPMSIKYTMLKDTFIQKDKKWIGKFEDKFYVIFIKNDTKKSISLLKKQVKNREVAIAMNFPSDTARSRFSSWNIFNKKE